MSKFIIEKGKFVDALERVVGLAAIKSTIPSTMQMTLIKLLRYLLRYGRS